MTRSERRDRPVSEDEYETMPERVGRHFDRVRTLLDRETERRAEPLLVDPLERE